MKLTKKAVAKLTLPEGKRDHIQWDAGLPGFGFRLRKGAGGTIRSWVCQFRVGRTTRRMTLGKAEVLDAEQARLMAKQALGDVAHGRDPQAAKRSERAKEKNKDAFSGTVALYLEAKKPEVRATTHVGQVRYLSSKRYFGPLHGLALDQITRKDVARELTRISLERRSTIVSGKARAQLSALFVWAIGQGLCEQNPVVGTVKPKAEEPRERVLADDELARIWQACRDDDHGRIVKLLMLTGARRQEIGSIRWSEFDDPKHPGTWTLPKERSKNKRPHTLPVLPMMNDIIKGVLLMASRDQLFGQRGAGFANWSMHKASLDERCGVKGWTVHDIRRSVATHMADLGIAPHIIEQILNHQSGHKAGPAGIYNRSLYPREVRAALATWHDFLRTLIEGGERKVVSLHATAS